MDNKQPNCNTGSANCLSTMRCKCANTQKWIVSTSGPKKNKNVAKNQYAHSCARREAGVLELYESRISLQNKREREVKMYKLIVDDYIRVSKQYLPPSVSQN